MDTQFKQRLTGAVILALLAVLLVPELLTGPKPPATGPVPSAPGPAATPEAAAPLRSYDIDLSETPMGGIAATAMDSPEVPAATAGTRAAVSAPQPAASATRTTPGARVPGAQSSSASAASSSAGAPSVPPPAAPQTSQSPAPTAAATPTPSAMSGFAVQVGSFSSSAYADRLARDLKRRRFEVFIAPVRSSGKQFYRVRVGPVADRDAAHALAAQLKSAGQAGSIVPVP